MGIRTAFPRLFRYDRRTQTLFDQAIVSGSNFLTGIILVRGLGLTEFGKFTVAYAILLLANSVQLSFISSPMLTLGSLCPTPEQRRRLVRGIFGVQLIFCAIASVLVVAAAIVYLYLHPSVSGKSVALPFAASVVFFLMQDWLRRYYFTMNKAAHSVWNDAISYLGQLIVLAVLWWMHRLTLESAFWTIAITSGLAFALGALIERLNCTASETREAWRQARGISLNLGIANQLQWLVYQGAMLVGAGVVGAQAAGGVRATQNVIGPVNVAYQAMENIVPIRAAEEMRRGGIQSAAKYLFRIGSIGFIVLSVLFLTASFFSSRFLSVAYGHQLGAYSGVLNLQMLYFLLAWPVRQLSFLFRTIQRTSAILLSSVVAAGISMLLVYPAVRHYGALGIMVAAVTGQIANLLYLIIAWSRVSSSAHAQNITVQVS